MNSPTADWLDQLVQQISEQVPAGQILVSSGHSPSGTYHVGTLREIMTANAIAWALRRAGRDAKHIDVVDDFDAFRKVPYGVPEEWKRYIGVPVRLVPDPFECHDSYGAHYLEQLNEGLAAVGAVPDIQKSGYDMYQAGELTDQIVASLDHLDDVRRILTEVGGRQLEDGWAPVQFLDDNNNLRRWKFAGWDHDRQMLQWRDADGNSGELAVNSGRIALSWRLDWPARWAKLGIGVEPFGRDHATKGGSYDTGSVLVRDIFGGQPPIPVPYEFINTVGETKKMSKSSGNVLTPKQALEVMPAEILRYFVIKARPSRTLNFDSGLGLYALIDEFAKSQVGELAGAMAYAKAVSDGEMISTIPFNHLVSVYQAGRGDVAVVRDILERTDYEVAVAGEWPVIERELTFVRNWLEKYAPDSVKFAVQDTLPKLNLSDTQRLFLRKLSATIEVEGDLNGQGMHDAIYAASQVAAMKPGPAFVTLYQVILGQDSGPKAGWFLASLGHDWLVNRLSEAAESKALAANRAATAEVSAPLPDGRKFIIEADIAQQFPQTAVGYIVADVSVEPVSDDAWAGVSEALSARDVTKDTLKDQAEIAAWREAYKQFGVKPSDYRSSVEALTRRILDGKIVQVNPVVDAYNAQSVRSGLPMGAMDLDKIAGDIHLRFGRDGEQAKLFGLDKLVEVTSKQAVYADDNRIITWLWNYRDAPDTGVTEVTKRAIFFVDSVVGADGVRTAIEQLKSAIAGLPGSSVLDDGILSF